VCYQCPNNLPDDVSLVSLGYNAILVARHTFRPHGRSIDHSELHRLGQYDIFIGWKVASLETAARQPNWCQDTFEGIQSVYRGGPSWLM
jgi:hypothetical protein